jgi:hypothetical protein
MDASDANALFGFDLTQCFLLLPQSEIRSFKSFRVGGFAGPILRFITVLTNRSRLALLEWLQSMRSALMLEVLPAPANHGGCLMSPSS